MTTQAWQLDPVHSTIQFSVQHLVVARVHGRFEQWSAEIALDEADPTRSLAQVTIEAASIATGNAERDGHLRSADFLDVDHHPKLTFRSRQIVPAGKGRYRVQGELSIRGVTRNVTLEAQLGGFITDPWGARRVGVTASTSILRSEYGLVWNQVLEAGGVAVADRVEIAIELEAIAAAAERAA